MTKTN